MTPAGFDQLCRETGCIRPHTPVPDGVQDCDELLDGEPLFLEAFHGRTAKLGPEHPHTLDSLKQLVTLYESWNKPDEAAKWRAKLVQTGVTGQ